MADYSEAKAYFDKVKAAGQNISSDIQNILYNTIGDCEGGHKVLFLFSDLIDFGTTEEGFDLLYSLLEEYQPEVIVTPHIGGKMVKFIEGWIAAYNGYIHTYRDNDSAQKAGGGMHEHMHTYHTPRLIKLDFSSKQSTLTSFFLGVIQTKDSNNLYKYMTVLFSGTHHAASVNASWAWKWGKGKTTLGSRAFNSFSWRGQIYLNAYAASITAGLSPRIVKSGVRAYYSSWEMALAEPKP